MSLFIAQHQTHTDPELWESTHEAVCEICGRAWDWEDEREQFRLDEAGTILCASNFGGESCFHQHERMSFKQQVRDRVGPKLLEIRELLNSIHADHSEYMRGENEDPSGLLDEILTEVQSL